MKKKKWAYRSPQGSTGECFALTRPWGRNRRGGSMNFWHITPDQEVLYTFQPNDKYNIGTVWSERICREFERDLRSPQPSVKVIRFAINGTAVFVSEPHLEFPLPKTPSKERWRSEWKTEEQMQREEARQNRILIEEIKGQESAPLILYGKHRPDGKEFAWKLTPDKPKRQGIRPGDRVLVWTRNGFYFATVTKILPADGTFEPTARVKKKLTADEKIFSEAEQW